MGSYRRTRRRGAQSRRRTGRRTYRRRTGRRTGRRRTGRRRTGRRTYRRRRVSQRKGRRRTSRRRTSLRRTSRRLYQMRGGAGGAEESIEAFEEGIIRQHGQKFPDLYSDPDGKPNNSFEIQIGRENTQAEMICAIFHETDKEKRRRDPHWEYYCKTTSEDQELPFISFRYSQVKGKGLENKGRKHTTLVREDLKRAHKRMLQIVQAGTIRLPNYKKSFHNHFQSIHDVYDCINTGGTNVMFYSLGERQKWKTVRHMINKQQRLTRLRQHASENPRNAFREPESLTKQIAEEEERQKAATRIQAAQRGIKERERLAAQPKEEPKAEQQTLRLSAAANPRTSSSSGPESPQVSPSFTSPQIKALFDEIDKASSQLEIQEIVKYLEEIQQIADIENAIKSAETVGLEKKIDEELRKIQKYNARIKSLQSKISVRTDAIGDNTDALAQLETELKQLELDAHGLQQVLTRYREEKKKVEVSMTKIQEKIDGLKQDISGEVSGVGTSDQGVRNIDVKKQLLIELDAYEKEFAEHKVNFDILSDKIAVQESVQTSLITQMGPIIEEIQTRKTNITDMTQGIGKKTQQVEDRQSNIQELKDKIGELAGILETLVETSNDPVTGGSE